MGWKGWGGGGGGGEKRERDCNQAGMFSSYFVSLCIFIRFCADLSLFICVWPFVFVLVYLCLSLSTCFCPYTYICPYVSVVICLHR